MKILSVTFAAALASTSAFMAPSQLPSTKASTSTLSMVLEKPATKKISKLETLKVKSENLRNPLGEVRYQQESLTTKCEDKI